MDGRDQDWIRTFTGRQFYPLSPRAADVCIEDIAHALSMLCRYTGHVQRFYSVAEHSVLVAGITADRISQWSVDGDTKRDILKWALLHDASEAYVGDMTRPLKHQPEMERYRDAEKAVMGAIVECFGLLPNEPSVVALVDKEIIGSEARLLKWGETLATVDPLPAMHPFLRGAYGSKVGVSPEKAERAFLDMWETLTAPAYEDVLAEFNARSQGPRS